MVGVAAPAHHDVQRDRGRGGEGPPELLGQLRIEGRIAEDLLSGEVHVVVEEGPARQIEHDLHRGLVEGHGDAGEAAHPGLVAESLAEGLAQHDAGVLDGVVGVHLEVAPGLHG